MEDQIKKLAEELLRTEDSRTAYSLALELQHVVCEHLEQQKKTAKASSVHADDRPGSEIGLSSTSFDRPRSKKIEREP